MAAFGTADALAQQTGDADVSPQSAADALADELSSALTCASARFVHACNSQARLARAEADASATFIEADVILGMHAPADAPAAGGRVDPPIAVCAHDPGASSDLSFHELVLRSAAGGRGLKADVKSWGAVGSVLHSLKTYLARSGREEVDPLAKPFPLFALTVGTATLLIPALIVNADVLTCSAGCTFNSTSTLLPRAEQVEEARTFLEAISQAVPLSIVSPGWTTVGEGAGAEEEVVEGAAPPSSSACYSESDVDDMLSVVADYADAGMHFTFPVRASYVRASVGPLSRLLSRVPGSTLTVWSNVRLPRAQEAWLRAALDPARTLYDLPPQPEEGGWGGGGEGGPTPSGGHKAGGGGGGSLLPPLPLLQRAVAAGVAVSVGLLLTLLAARAVLQRSRR